MSTNRINTGGNFDQTRDAIAQQIIKHNGNINSLMKDGIVSEYASANTKKTVLKFLKNDTKDILKDGLTYSEKVEKLNQLVYYKFQNVSTNKYTIHEVNTKDVQLVPYEINSRYNHDGGVSDCRKDQSRVKQCMKK